MVLSLSVRLLPFANVNVFVPVNVVRVSIVALNSKSVFFVSKPPEAVKKGTILAGDTIDLAGAAISSDGTGSISIAATGATLPAGSKAGENQLAVVSSSGETIPPTRVVPFFTAAGGLNVTNTNFEFNATIDTRTTFTGTKTFTLANGSNLTDSDSTIFQF